MVKPYTIEMIEKLAVTDGTVKASENGTKNGFIGKVVDGVFAPATAGAEALALNWGKGDDMYTEFTTPAGEFVTAFALDKWVGKMLQVTPESIAYAEGETYADLKAGVEMKADTDGNLAIGATTAGVGFKVVKPINFGGNGVLVEIIKK